MTRERFSRVVRQVLDSLPEHFRRRMSNVAVLVQDRPRAERRRMSRAPGARSRPKPLLMGEFIGVPATEKSVFSVAAGPDYVMLYQKNIEAVCRTERELRHEIRQTVLHELGHYFGMDEEQLRDV